MRHHEDDRLEHPFASSFILHPSSFVIQMIPVRLNFRNFMCYTDVHAPLEFDGIHVACLSGANGHGKSALLDAITWALWGRSRARTADELIHIAPGCTEME